VKRFVSLALLGIAAQSGAQLPIGAACDSVIAAAKVDDTPAGIFLSAHEVSGTAPESQLRRIVVNVGNEFVPPRPFKLRVFTGPSLVPGLRAIGSDTARVVRALTVTAIYRVVVQGGDSVPKVLVIRRSMVDGFDSAAVSAIRGSSSVPGLFVASTGSPMTLDVAFTSDSLVDSQRLFTASFPRMPVTDARPLADVAPAKYPEEAAGDSVRASVLLRFVVSADGLVEPATVEVVRPAPMVFLKAAYESLSQYRFAPATVNGCAVAQQVDYPFAFLPPQGARKD
jgi:TonB family protein